MRSAAGAKRQKNTIAFFEVFQEEKIALQSCLSPSLQAQFFPHPITRTENKNAPAEILCIRTQSRIPSAWLPQLKGVLTRSSGYDHLLAIRRQIPCGYLPRYCVRAVAEQAVLMLLALMRRLPQQTRNFKTFNRDGLTGRELLNTKLLVLGVGRIGGEVARIARSLQMDVRGVDLVARETAIKYVALAAGMRWAEAVICCLPLTKMTRGILNFPLFKNSRRGIILVNVGRGEVSPLKDLDKALRLGYLSGLGLDVFEDEADVARGLRGRTQYQSACLVRVLQNHDNVIFTPHNAFNTQEAVARKAVESATALDQFVRKGCFPHPVPEQ